MQAGFKAYFGGAPTDRRDAGPDVGQAVLRDPEIVYWALTRISGGTTSPASTMSSPSSHRVQLCIGISKWHAVSLSPPTIMH